ncbi:MAG: hypothetical protein EXX96DRAFT_603738 [Benjaminiella poitrasii]|nr:MAG: hypothetical protein EXX96DRAFT_603738 [Benjaminiella poitrasii]
MYRLCRRLAKSEEVMNQLIKEQIVLNHTAIGRVDEFQISIDLAAYGAFNFSGTDNGLVTMTGTVRLSMESRSIRLSNSINVKNELAYGKWYILVKLEAFDSELIPQKPSKKILNHCMTAQKVNNFLNENNLWRPFLYRLFEQVGGDSRSVAYCAPRFLKLICLLRMFYQHLDVAFRL